jgi:hypothetical protein
MHQFINLLVPQTNPTQYKELRREVQAAAERAGTHMGRNDLLSVSVGRNRLFPLLTEK